MVWVISMETAWNTILLHIFLNLSLNIKAFGVILFSICWYKRRFYSEGHFKGIHEEFVEIMSQNQFTCIFKIHSDQGRKTSPSKYKKQGTVNAIPSQQKSCESIKNWVNTFKNTTQCKAHMTERLALYSIRLTLSHETV